MGSVFLDSPVRAFRAFPSRVGRGETLHIEFATTSGARDQSAAAFDIAVFGPHGRRIATIATGPVSTRDGMVSLEWSGAGPNGARVNPGTYLLRVATPLTGFRVERRFELSS